MIPGNPTVSALFSRIGQAFTLSDSEESKSLGWMIANFGLLCVPLCYLTSNFNSYVSQQIVPMIFGCILTLLLIWIFHILIEIYKFRWTRTPDPQFVSFMARETHLNDEQKRKQVLHLMRMIKQDHFQKVEWALCKECLRSNKLILTPFYCSKLLSPSYGHARDKMQQKWIQEWLAFEAKSSDSIKGSIEKLHQLYRDYVERFDVPHELSLETFSQHLYDIYPENMSMKGNQLVFNIEPRKVHDPK